MTIEERVQFYLKAMKEAQEALSTPDKDLDEERALMSTPHESDSINKRTEYSPG